MLCWVPGGSGISGMNVLANKSAAEAILWRILEAGNANDQHLGSEITPEEYILQFVFSNTQINHRLFIVGLPFAIPQVGKNQTPQNKHCVHDLKCHTCSQKRYTFNH